jgi:hypothetical protein
MDDLVAPDWNIYRQVVIPQANQSVRIIATYINWDELEVDRSVIAENSERIKGRIKIEKGEPSYEPVAIVGFGPSLRETWEQIKDFKIIYTCSGAHRFLVDRGIIPTFHVDSDPRAYKADILGNPHQDVEYLISSICHPTYFDKLELYHNRVKLWHMLFLEPEIFKFYPKMEWIMTGGHTVGPRTIKLARMMGHANLHIFGMDGCVDSEGRTHATEHPSPPTDLDWMEFNGRRYYTNHNWEDHAVFLLKELDRQPEIKYQFYGNGLIQEMAKLHVPVKRATMPMRVYKDEKGACMW